MAGLQDAYFQMPVITRSYATGCFLTTLACQLDIVNPLHLYMNTELIFRKHQYWRLITNFLYFGEFSLDFVFHMFFLIQYCRRLEEGSFRGKTGDFFYLMFLGALCMLCIGPYANVYFLGSSLTFMLVYLWGRRNPSVGMNFLGLFVFPADYLPWFLLGFSLLLNHNITADLIGIAIGHMYYFLEDVYPKEQSLGGMGGPRVLVTPSIIARMFDGDGADPNYVPPVWDDQPGGFNWGGDEGGQQQ